MAALVHDHDDHHLTAGCVACIAASTSGPRAEGLSYDRRLTLRRRQLLDQGIHPVTRKPLAGNGETCGTCVHRYASRLGKTYHKCDLNATRGPATDIRVSWPACNGWEPTT